VAALAVPRFHGRDGVRTPHWARQASETLGCRGSLGHSHRADPGSESPWGPRPPSCRQTSCSLGRPLEATLSSEPAPSAMFPSSSPTLSPDAVHHRPPPHPIHGFPFPPPNTTPRKPSWVLPPLLEPHALCCPELAMSSCPVSLRHPCELPESRGLDTPGSTQGWALSPAHSRCLMNAYVSCCLANSTLASFSKDEVVFGARCGAHTQNGGGGSRGRL
jgi:hypothetical protein